MDGQVPVYDVVGVGFGPSNLALAIALAEYHADGSAGDPITAHFLERQPSFGWHRGMLIDTATMQVSFLKDLVTMRNPTSEFSFLNYLHARGRLADFINHKTLFPLRVEFHDYFAWAAEKVDDVVSYGSEVVSVQPVLRGGAVAYFDVRARCGGETTELRARNLVLGTGLRPNLPDGITAGERIWHNSELLYRVESLRGSPARRFVVIGAGQSAAEVAALLHDEFPRAEVCAVFARYGYSPADDSSFANRIFDPEGVDQFYTASDPVKDRLMRYHGATNYSAVDLDLIDELYRRRYREKVLGVERLRWFNVSRPVEVTDEGTHVRATVESLTTGERAVLDADAVVYATGYLPADPTPLLGSLAQRCHRDAEGRLRVERDYRITTDAGVHGGLYLQGGTEHTHGITSSLLSNTAVRVGEILQSIVDRREAAADRPEYAVSGTR
ncbi:L-ornithine N5-oxygenase [Amycolatopsis jiangsuensis]|uniref:L-lysine N6-monooxygenase MbtG n=1 Tax=Amycolatopsis jiangsuensis TaxID=1181879 RepID=A0A840IN03_9PSEU|nr:SidA/IucD/PvdA family monooxygenase [Amycolatopsis jiangsuensis]MBB4683330.1 L-ornithine N5-oxygenase [Amycolatopsis jiangsuensis]